MRKLLRSSYRNTREFYGSSIKKTTLWIVASILVGGSIHVWVAGVEAAMSEWILFVIYGLAPMGVLTILLFLWSFWLAPYRLMAERLDEAIDQKTVEGPSHVPEQAVLEDWRDVASFQLKEAACLWVGLEPHWPLETQKTRAALVQLTSAVKMETLVCPPYGFQSFVNLVYGRARWPSSIESVTAIDLARYAQSLDKIPEFLKHVEIPEPETVEGTNLLPPSEEKKPVEIGDVK